MRVSTTLFLISLALSKQRLASASATTGTPAVSTDNSCGGNEKLICNPSDPLGGPCCSAYGWCGKSKTYCSTGCQEAFSAPGSCTSVENNPEAINAGQRESSSSSTRKQVIHHHHSQIHSLHSKPKPTTSPSMTPSPGRSPPATKQGGQWIVNGTGSFSNYAHFTFENDNIPEGLYVSEYQVEDPHAPCHHTFVSENVEVRDGYLQLLVPGGQTGKQVKCAEVGTTVDDIFHASVRTVAIFSHVPGTCHGLFFYKDDTQESDIEFLTDSTSLSNPDGKCMMQYTNQAITGVTGEKTHATGPAPPNHDTRPHEYRIDWTPGKVMFFIDGVFQKTFTTNVPTVPGSWLWNNWANGDPGWTGKLPKEDNVLKISEITMYYNRAG